MSVGLNLFYILIAIIFCLLSARSWTLLGALFIIEGIWGAVSCYLGWLSVSLSEIGIIFWAISALYLGAVELALLVILVTLYGSSTGQATLT